MNWYQRWMPLKSSQLQLWDDGYTPGSCISPCIGYASLDRLFDLPLCKVPSIRFAVTHHLLSFWLTDSITARETIGARGKKNGRLLTAAWVTPKAEAEHSKEGHCRGFVEGQIMPKSVAGSIGKVSCLLIIFSMSCGCENIHWRPSRGAFIGSLWSNKWAGLYRFHGSLSFCQNVFHLLPQYQKHGCSSCRYRLVMSKFWRSVRRSTLMMKSCSSSCDERGVFVHSKYPQLVFGKTCNTQRSRLTVERFQPVGWQLWLGNGHTKWLCIEVSAKTWNYRSLKLVPLFHPGRVWIRSLVTNLSFSYARWFSWHSYALPSFQTHSYRPYKGAESRTIYDDAFLLAHLIRFHFGAPTAQVISWCLSGDQNEVQPCISWNMVTPPVSVWLRMRIGCWCEKC